MEDFNKILDKTEYQRPTTAVRVRPYVFLYQTIFERIEAQGINAKPPLVIQGEGNVNEGSRVTWGFRIRVVKVDPTAQGVINFNGTALTLPIGINEWELIDTTKNSAGIDKTQYVIFSQEGAFYINIIEQLMILTPL
jgi:hypothetical protein